MPDKTSHRYAVVVAGGSGTRLWPLSRRNLPKQMQKFVSDKTLIDETVDRLSGLVPKENIYISTTGNYGAKIKELLPDISASNIIVEPIARGTTAAFALLTATILERDPEATIFTLASDHAVSGVEQFQATLSDAYDFVEKHTKTIALVGIKPVRPDTGFGYIKVDEVLQKTPLVYSVEKFVEKPTLEVAKTYLESDQYYWNAAYCCFSAATFVDAYNDADPAIFEHIYRYMETGDVEDFMKVPIKAQEIEFIDSKKFPLVTIPADFKWSDIGNWQALHELLAEVGDNDLVHHGGEHIDINSTNSLIFSTDNRLVATVGLDNIAVVSTGDVLLVLNKDQPQQIKQLLENLKNQGLTEYL